MKKVIKPARMPARNRNSAARQSKSKRAQPRPELPELARLAASADKLAEAAYKLSHAAEQLLFATRAGAGTLRGSIGGGPPVADKTAGPTTRDGETQNDLR
jgi:hypothetical protein